MSSQPELSVVCKSCGSEVSPYVTECPYCGTRLRKRAPKLERRGGDLTAKRKRGRAARGPRLPRIRAGSRAYATITVVLGSSLVLLAQRALDRPLNDFGAIVGPVGSEWWRFFAAPFAYTDMGYLFVVGLTIAVFGSALERRLGTLPVALLFAACGALGMLAADALDPLVRGDTHILVAAGGNGIALGAIAAWLQIRRAESRGFSDDYVDLVGVAVFVAVLAVLPLVEDTANGWVALGGLAVGAAAGLAATLSGRGAE